MTESRNHDDTAPSPGDAKRVPWQMLDPKSTRALIGFASQTVVLTAVLFYFGWARVRATYAYFGIDVSVLNFSVSDYVLRSVSVAFPLLVALGLLTAGAVLVNDRLSPSLANNPLRAVRLTQILLAVGWGLVGVGFLLAVVLTGPGGSSLPGPVAMLIGFGLIVYALMVGNRYVARTQSRLIVIVAALLVLALFWTVTAYANFVGVQVARRLQATLPTGPNVTVYSSSNLSLVGPGLTASNMANPGGAYRFRYSGLRLLLSSGDRYFLLPAGWHPGKGSVIVLPVSPSGINILVQFQGPAL